MSLGEDLLFNFSNRQRYSVEDVVTRTINHNPVLSFGGRIHGQKMDAVMKVEQCLYRSKSSIRVGISMKNCCLNLK